MTIQTVRNIRYLFTDLYGSTHCELPLTGVTFSLVLNGAGPFQATLALDDPKVQQLPWRDATRPNLSLVWVLIDGIRDPVYGGIVTGRSWQESSRACTLNATDFWGHLSQRVQAADYSTNWAAPPGHTAASMAYQILTDAAAADNSLPFTVGAPAYQTSNYITYSAPITQRQTISSMVSQLASMGYEIGFDFASDPFMVSQHLDNGVLSALPQGQISLHWPRRGRAAGTTGLIVDLSVVDDFWWPEDGTVQADLVYEMASSSGGSQLYGAYGPAIDDYGYPLLEKVASHPSTAASGDQAGLLGAFLAGDLMVYAFPGVVPAFQTDIFGTAPLGSFLVGDDIRVVCPLRAGGVPGSPRFPDGLDIYLRIVQADVTVGDQGRSTMKVTLNVPPSTNPTAPPQ